MKNDHRHLCQWETSTCRLSIKKFVLILYNLLAILVGYWMWVWSLHIRLSLSLPSPSLPMTTMLGKSFTTENKSRRNDPKNGIKRQWGILRECWRASTYIWLGERRSSSDFWLRNACNRYRYILKTVINRKARTSGKNIATSSSKRWRSMPG